MELEVKDSNGAILKDGDSVVIIQSLKVKGASDIKRGAVMRKIRLTDNMEEIEGKVENVQMVLKTRFVKKM